MPLTKDEFESACRQTCPMCANGYLVRYREDTQEFVHDWGGKGQFSHQFCLATGLRKMYGAGELNGQTSD